MKFLAKRYYVESNENIIRANKALIYRIVKSFGAVDLDTINAICLKVVPKKYFVHGMFCTKPLVKCLELEGYVVIEASVVKFVNTAA